MCMYSTDTQISPEAAGREKSSESAVPVNICRLVCFLTRGKGEGGDGGFAVAGGEQDLQQHVQVHPPLQGLQPAGGSTGENLFFNPNR